MRLSWRATARVRQFTVVDVKSERLCSFAISNSEPTQPTAVDDDPIERSPLERAVTRDGTTVDIYIHRGPDCRPGWLLEVEDEAGGSTVWDDLFDTDQEALAAAMKAIDEEGIESFAQGTISQETRS